MSTTHGPTDADATPRTDPPSPGEGDTAEPRRTLADRAHRYAPRTFSTTGRAPLPPAFDEETWATGDP
jgi:hypothetical protein